MNPAAANGAPPPPPGRRAAAGGPASAAPLVAVVGSVNLDRTLEVEHLPAAGETIRARHESLAGGGKGANAALASQLAGAPTALIARVGADHAAQIALADLAAAGVATDSVRAVDAPTGSATILIDARGQNSIVITAGANDRLDARQVHEALARLGGLRVVLVNFEIGDDAILAAAGVAASRGLKLIVNPAPARALPDRLLALSPILTPNEEEIAQLTRLGPDAGARHLCALTGAPVIVTLGGDGALVVAGDQVVHLPAPAVTAVDTSGAGDVLNGTLAASLAVGHDLLDALASAVQAASQSTQNSGARLSAVG
ncbi:MAG: ribokinase [Actinomycetia bacterium]|nr:ribokinase [Actinomycetes bacterium]